VDALLEAFMHSHFTRLARHLQEVYDKRQAEERRLQEYRWAELNRQFEQAQHRHRLCQTACARQWFAAASQEQQALNRTLHRCQEIITCLRDSPPKVAPSYRELTAEIVQLHEEFEEVSIDWKHKSLIVQTDWIELQDVELGRFRICLHWQRLVSKATIDCIEIMPLDPNPSASNDNIPHPHVRDGVLCTGEAALPLHKALEQGRLVDAFCLIRSVLQTYNPDSAHARLEQWSSGYSCWNCSCEMSEEERCYCDGCDQDMCEDCVSSCKHCDRIRCSSCQGTCEVCKEHCCRRCLTVSASAKLSCCKDCLRECTRCGDKVASSEFEDVAELCEHCAASPVEPDPLTPTLSGESDGP
jgi:hypothetical protein